jgi:hypothetical protein
MNVNTQDAEAAPPGNGESRPGKEAAPKVTFESGKNYYRDDVAAIIALAKQLSKPVVIEKRVEAGDNFPAILEQAKKLNSTTEEGCPNESASYPVKDIGIAYLYQVSNKVWRAGFQRFDENQPQMLGDFKSRKAADIAIKSAAKAPRNNNIDTTMLFFTQKSAEETPPENGTGTSANGAHVPEDNQLTARRITDISEVVKPCSDTRPVPKPENWRKLDFHDFAKWFPQLKRDEIEALSEDITENGLQEPIVLYEGEILDGRNRYTACELARIYAERAGRQIECKAEPRFVEYVGTDPLGFVMSMNAHRRHLDYSTRVAIAAQLANAKRGGDRPSKSDENFESQKVGIRNGECTQEKAAAMLHVSTEGIRQYRRVEEQSPELLDQVTYGKISLNKAVQKLDNRAKREANKARKQKGKQKQIAKRGVCERGDEFVGEQATKNELRHEFERTWPALYNGYLHQFDPDDRAEIEDWIWQEVQGRRAERAR